MRGDMSSQRGRSSRRTFNRSLKFHNFIPSESVTSQKKSVLKETTTSADLQFQAECRLQEEHGTKRIMVSQWSVGDEESSRNPPVLSAPKTEFKFHNESVFQEVSPKVHSPQLARPTPTRFTFAPTFQLPIAATGRPPIAFPLDETMLTKKRKRKPTQIRRIVPYEKTSRPSSQASSDDPGDNDECQETPLDLTVKGKERSLVDLSPLRSALQGTSLSSGTSNSSVQSSSTCPSTTLSQFESCHRYMPPANCSQESDFGYDDSPFHRSQLLQRMEDSMGNNGFLVKTKQVTDGDATFCKFRQLRKYTRYYLKSWQQNFPAEVNKIWKGFLPPKTMNRVPETGLPPSLFSTPEMLSSSPTPLPTAMIPPFLPHQLPPDTTITPIVDPKSDDT